MRSVNCTAKASSDYTTSTRSANWGHFLEECQLDVTQVKKLSKWFFVNYTTALDHPDVPSGKTSSIGFSFPRPNCLWVQNVFQKNRKPRLSEQKKVITLPTKYPFTMSELVFFCNKSTPLSLIFCFLEFIFSKKKDDQWQYLRNI